jgi:hypothetical protein
MNPGKYKSLKFALFRSPPTCTPRGTQKSQNTAIVKGFSLSYVVKCYYRGTKKPRFDTSGAFSNLIYMMLDQNT